MSRPRVFISTDIGGGDHDDDQSLVHALLYSDIVNIVGISQTVATLKPGGSVKDIHEVIAAYEKDYDKLKTHSGDYATPDYLRSISHQGAKVGAPTAGFSKATAGSKAIVDAAREASPSDPLYVLTWGGETDIAQALHDAPDIAANIRLLTINRQDPNASAYLENNWKTKIWWVQDKGTFRGMYADGPYNRPYEGSDDWVATNAKGHGALGDYFDKMSHGLYQQGKSPKYDGYGIKMGDTPSFLYVLDVARNGRTDPTQEGWGGEFVKQAANYWTDDPAASLMIGNWKGAKTVAEDRAAYMADFARRLDRADDAKGSSDPKSPQPPKPPKPPVPTDDAVSVGRNEAESLLLSKYVVENHNTPSADKWVKVAGSGTIAGTFDGATGTYKVNVAYFDEHDGKSAMSLLVNGKVVKSWTAAVNDNKIHIQSVDVKLKAGDRISVTGQSNGGEFARIDHIDVMASASTAAVVSSVAAIDATGDGRADLAAAEASVNLLEALPVNGWLDRDGDYAGTVNVVAEDAWSVASDGSDMLELTAEMMLEDESLGDPPFEFAPGDDAFEFSGDDVTTAALVEEVSDLVGATGSRDVANEPWRQLFDVSLPDYMLGDVDGGDVAGLYARPDEMMSLRSTDAIL